MWQWLWLIIPLAVNSPFVIASPVSSTSVGPTSAEEASVLFEEGQKSFHDESYQTVIDDLQRLVDRYPAAPGYLAAHRMLGIAYLNLGKFKRALTPLKYYVQTAGNSTAGLETRLWLGAAYLGLGQSNDAYLCAAEIINRLEKEEDRKKITPVGQLRDIQIQALLLKADALLMQDHSERAIRAMTSAEQLISPDSPALLQAYLARVQLEIKTGECSRFSKTGPLEELQVKNQMERKGTCLLQAAMIYHDTLKTGEKKWSAVATQDLKAALKNYSLSCAHPPRPPGKRTQLELRRYTAELAELLRPECERNHTKLKELLNTWKQELPTQVTYYISTLYDSRPIPDKTDASRSDSKK